MPKIRAPMDMHTAFVVSLASFASVYYTLYPWIQEQKETKARLQYEAFQNLKQTDPALAQAHLDKMRNNERWYETKMREFRERHTLKAQVDEIYFDQRAEHGMKTVVFPDDLYAPIEPSQRAHIPTLEELDKAELLGRSLSIPSTPRRPTIPIIQQLAQHQNIDQSAPQFTEQIIPRSVKSQNTSNNV